VDASDVFGVVLEELRDIFTEVLNHFEHRRVVVIE
jgi:hypothetical protein